MGLNSEFKGLNCVVERAHTLLRADVAMQWQRPRSWIVCSAVYCRVVILSQEGFVSILTQLGQVVNNCCLVSEERHLTWVFLPFVHFVF